MTFVCYPTFLFPIHQTFLRNIKHNPATVCKAIFIFPPKAEFGLQFEKPDENEKLLVAVNFQ